MSDLVERLRGATRGLCSENAADYIPRGVSAADAVEAADEIERLSARIKVLEEVIAAREKQLNEEIALSQKFAAQVLQKQQEG